MRGDADRTRQMCKPTTSPCQRTPKSSSSSKSTSRRPSTEGPLGEYTGYYTPASPKPVVRATAITHRNGPIFQALLTGKPTTENHILKQLSFEASFYDTSASSSRPSTAVAIPPSGGVSFCRDLDEPRYRR